MALDATPAGATSNSYVTEATASAYLAEAHLYVASWTSATVSTREAALIWATSLLDQAFDWYGSKTSETQALRMPRYGLVDQDGYPIDYNSIPKLLERATAVFGLRLVERDRFSDPALLGLGISTAKLGPISVSLARNQELDFVPRDVTLMLGPLGSVRGGSTGGIFFKVRRT